MQAIAEEAGREALTFYGRSTAVDYKGDESPVTAADRAAHALILRRLRALAPEIPAVSEESDAQAPYAERRAWRRFWLVDPLDGTKEFIKAAGEFTVNVALVEDGRAVLGVVHAPALGVTYRAERGRGAFRAAREEGERPVRVRSADPARLAVAVSRDHAGERERAMLARIPGAVATPMGSALKFCLVAEGRADLYPRFAPTMEWDTAAAQCVLEEAGGALVTLDGAPLAYNKESLRNPAILAVGDPKLDWRPFIPPA